MQDGDGLYNGTLDDAAYVGTLIRFADKHKDQPLRRSVVVAAFTGEEKGLLGRLTGSGGPSDCKPKAAIVADINLDQLRRGRSRMDPPDGAGRGRLDARAWHRPRGRGRPWISASRRTLEPERGLAGAGRPLSVHAAGAGIPGTGFIFGYVPGTEAERRYREWYQVRYHRPQDDLTQPMDFEAAGKFNRFFYKLAETVADAAERPAWTH